MRLRGSQSLSASNKDRVETGGAVRCPEDNSSGPESFFATSPAGFVIFAKDRNSIDSHQKPPISMGNRYISVWKAATMILKKFRQVRMSFETPPREVSFLALPLLRIVHKTAFQSKYSMQRCVQTYISWHWLWPHITRGSDIRPKGSSLGHKNGWSSEQASIF
jgi:hypothetical protein